MVTYVALLAYTCASRVRGNTKAIRFTHLVSRIDTSTSLRDIDCLLLFTRTHKLVAHTIRIIHQDVSAFCPFQARRQPWHRPVEEAPNSQCDKRYSIPLTLLSPDLFSTTFSSRKRVMNLANNPSSQNPLLLRTPPLTEQSNHDLHPHLHHAIRPSRPVPALHQTIQPLNTAQVDQSRRRVLRLAPAPQRRLLRQLLRLVRRARPGLAGPGRRGGQDARDGGAGG